MSALFLSQKSPAANSLSQAVRWVALAALLCSALPASHLRAEEPASEFLNGLREKGYYDMAVLYLNKMENSDLVTTGFKQVLDYEKGATLAEAAKTERDFAERASMLDEANAALARFVKANPRHKFSAAANNQLGNLLVERARMMIEKAEKPSGAGQKSQLMKDAGELFDRAHKVFTEGKDTINRELKNIRPNLDPEKDAEQVALRDELRKQYLRAQLLLGAVLEEKAKTAKADKKKYNELLMEANTEYQDIYEKYRRLIVAHYARLYQGRAYQRMAEHADATPEEKKQNYQQALSYYTDVLEQPAEEPKVRTVITKTLLLALDAWVATDKVDAAVNKGLEWVEQMRPNEANDLEWIELRLKLAKALKQHADAQDDAKQEKAFVDEARKLASVIAKGNTNYKKDAQALMLKLGGGDGDSPAERPVAENFLEAKEYGRDALGRMQANDFALKNLPPQIKSESDSGIKAELEKQLKEASEGLAKNRQEAIDYFNQALAMANAETTTDDLNVVRYFLCYLNYIEGQYYRSAVLGEFLARRYPNSNGAKPSAKIAMAAYLKLYKEAEKGEREFESQQAVGIAQYITDVWADSPEAVEALNTLIPFMIQSGDLDQAIAYVDKIPEDSPVRGEAELKTGQAMWSRYLRENFELSKAQKSESPPADAAAREAELEELKNKAQAVLANGVERMRKSEKLDSTIATAVLSLAQVYVDLGQPAKAIPLLEDQKIGPLALVLRQDKDPVAKAATDRPGFAAETYKTALRAYIASLATAGNSEDTIKKARGVMGKLQESMGDTPKGQEKVVAIYISLARDLEKQLEISDAESKQALSKGFETFLTEVQKSATRFDVLNWIAVTFYSLGTGFDTGQGALNEQARDYYQKAINAYEKILANQKSDPEYMPNPEHALQVQMRMATVLRRMGQFEKAVKIFADILKQKQTMLNVQVEAAITLQEWAKEKKDNDKYLKAIQGDVKDADDKDIIWGWGQLSKVSVKYPQFRETFHDARFNMALAFYEMSQNETSNEKKQKYLTLAKNYMEATYRFYPDLGSEQRTTDYNYLLKKVQKALGEESVGLKAFEAKADSAE